MPFNEWIIGEMDRGLSQLEVDQMRAAWNAAIASLAGEQEPEVMRYQDAQGQYFYGGNYPGQKPVPLYRHPAPKVPAGWKLVPKKETSEMRTTAQNIATNNTGGCVPAWLATLVYEAMLSVAPEYKP